MINRKVCEVMKKDIELIEKIKEKNEIYKNTMKGQHRRIEELKQAKKVSKQIQKERNKRLRKENELLKERIDKAIEYMKPRFMNCIDNNKRYFVDNDIQQIYEILKGEKE